MSRTVAIVCAMPMELAPVVKRLSLRREPRGGLEVHVGSHAGREVVAVVTGMGTALASAGTRRLLDAVDVGHVMVVGITGGVDVETPIGTLVRPELVVNANTGDEFRPTGLDDHGPRGVLWTTDVMTPPGEYAALRARGVVGLDMETAAIAEVCDGRGLPWSVFRVISDGPADEVDGEVFAMSNQDGTPNPRNIVRYVVRHPHRVPRLARMGRNARRATSTAADAAAAAIEAIPV